MRGGLALLIGLALATGCSNRERANPFDPGNPDTRGRPSGFVALASNATVTLEWQRADTTGLRGFRLERLAPGESDFALIADLPATSRHYIDSGLLNGARHEYRLSFLFRNGATSAAAADFATPGPLRPWITQLLPGALLRISADGRHLTGEGLLLDGPTAVAVDPAQAIVWVSDPFLGRVVRYNSANSDIAVGSLVQPGALATDPVRHTAWVCDERHTEVAQLKLDGSRGVPAAVGPISYPIGVAVDPGDRSVWVCDRDARLVRRFSVDGLFRWSTAVARPSRIAIDSATGDGWATSFEGNLVTRLSAGGTPLDTISGLNGPIGVAIDPRRGRVWIAEARGNALVMLQRDGTVERRVSGFPEVREVAVDVETGNAWATVPGDGRVVVVAPSGTVVSSIGGLGEPIAIALDPGRIIAFSPERIGRLRSLSGEIVGAETLPIQGSTAIRRASTRSPSRSRTQ
jgi:sugar lactone lactonase YvrE